MDGTKQNSYFEFIIRIHIAHTHLLNIWMKKFRNLYNKTRQSYIYMFPIAGQTDWAEIFCGHSWAAGG